MPIYEFVCELCGRLVERLQKISDPPPDACPECGGRMAKIMSRSSFQLKGGGWYKDLYSSAAGSGADAGAAKTDGPSGASAETSKPKLDPAPAAAPAASPAPVAPAPAAPAKKD